MAEMDLAHIPRHIGGWERNLQTGGDAVLVHCVRVADPDRHSDALVSRFVIANPKGSSVGAADAASLGPLTQLTLNRGKEKY